MDEVKHGKPRVITAIVKDNLVFDADPGQRKIVTGVFRSIPIKNSDRNNVIINVISMENLDEETLKLPTKEQLTYFQSLAKKKDYVKLITNSFAPEIKFRETEKLAVVISRIGSTPNGRLRGRIHSLLIGPPATAKSKILEFLPTVTQRCGLAVGGMATGSGITAVLTTLEDGTKYPKGGIIVQCSGSSVVLDELNQFTQDDIGKTYSAMESGIIQYNKGGFNQEFIAETTIIAGANPKNGHYDEQLGMIKNINLPEPMISRFDVIVNVLPETKTQSRQISAHTHMIKQLTVEKYVEQNQLLKPEELLLLFNYASTLQT
jgi:DNA replicative helicase MCM subunit Mcm2 (Cdc46/Mcm family)